MRYYSTTGDAGTTSFGKGETISKGCDRVEFLGCLDEAQVVLGFAAVEAENNAHQETHQGLIWMQRSLFNAGTIIMGMTQDENPGLFWEDQLSEVENLIELFAPEVELRSFVLPGGSELSARIELARIAIRRLERVFCRLNSSAEMAGVDALPYFNRLSSLCFVMARHSNETLEVVERSL
ncbi:MAG: cob(I)yrinic acid a,c-diamide adenosyltransferase [Coriobacteriia bacterium]|nr:cob(I)yrinic acid a,c-diamide adenosyltransferase [Coriobacteriia bacterium]MCL2537116.1 cob(I)yrinic acid a,c-diamide adenosyltransferase [Coriobacteriia bacterium]